MLSMKNVVTVKWQVQIVHWNLHLKSRQLKLLENSEGFLDVLDYLGKYKLFLTLGNKNQFLTLWWKPMSRFVTWTSRFFLGQEKLFFIFFICIEINT